MMHRIVKELMDSIDRETAQRGSKNTLVLFGDRGSAYLCGIEKRAKKLGLITSWAYESGYGCCAAKVQGSLVPVYDAECENYVFKRCVMRFFSEGGPDIDCIAKPGLSCCAEACLEIVKRMVPYDGCLVAVTGRGHAQQGIGEALTAEGCSVLLAHGDSGIMSRHIVNDYADAIINTSSRFMWPYFAKNVDTETIIDVCGRIPIAAEKQNYFSATDIGALNISILLRRFTEV